MTEPRVFNSTRNNHPYVDTHDLDPGWYWFITGDRDPNGPYDTSALARADAVASGAARSDGSE